MLRGTLIRTSALSLGAPRVVPTSADFNPAAPIDCGCNTEKVNVVHAYLDRHFSDYVRRDFHAPTRLMQAGLPMSHADHHVVSLTHEGVLPYYAVLLREFFGHSVRNIETCLQQWNLAAALRACRIIIVSRDGAAAL